MPSRASIFVAMPPRERPWPWQRSVLFPRQSLLAAMRGLFAPWPESVNLDDSSIDQGVFEIDPSEADCSEHMIKSIRFDPPAETA